MPFHPYLVFSGDCRHAFTRYKEIFGGELTLLTMADAPPEASSSPEHADLIMHAALVFGENLLMGSDDPGGDGGRKTGFAVNYTTADPDEAKRVFEGLADGGEVTMQLEEVFWSPLFGMCTDRFGVPWMVNVEAPAPNG